MRCAAFIEKSVFEYLNQLYEQRLAPKQSIDLSADIFPILCSASQMVGYLTKDWWMDIGSLQRHKWVTDELLSNQFGHLEI